MDVTVYIEYVDDFNDDFEIKNYYKDNDYINELNKLKIDSDKIYNTMESLNNGIISSLSDNNSIYDKTIPNEYKTSENAFKCHVNRCECSGEADSCYNGDVIDEMVYSVRYSANFMVSIKLDFDTSDIEFEEELRNWKNDEKKTIKLKFKNKSGSYSYAKLNECKIIGLRANILTLRAENLNFIKDIEE